MDQIEKFLRKLQPKLRKQITDILFKLIKGETKGLDISSLQGQEDWYRCKKGKIRIIYYKTKSKEIVIFEIRFRGDAYKK